MAAKVFPWTKRTPFCGMGDLANQIQRAALSISNNIAEGFERGSTNELINFLYIARGSAGEVRSMLCVMDRMQEFSELKSDIVEFRNRFESISRQIRGWTHSLQNSDIAGQRHLNDRSRSAYQQKQRRAEIDSHRKQFLESKAQEFRQQVQLRNTQKHPLQDDDSQSK